MELDELKEKWAEHDRKLDQSLRLNRQLLREMYTRRAKFALGRLAAMLAAGSLFMLIVIVLLGRFIALHWSTPRVSLPAIVLDLAAIAVLAALVAQIGLAMTIDYNQPVAEIQKRLETLRKFRIRYIQAIILTTWLAWAPIFIVVTRGVLGLDVRWIAINVALGLAVPALVIWIFQKFAPRMSQKFLNELAGYNLKAASGFLTTLAEFEKDYSPQERSSIREYSPEE
jgi:MFS family permease